MIEIKINTFKYVPTIKITFLFLLAVLLLSNTTSNSTKTTHKISIVHPAIDKDRAIDYYLIQEVLPNKAKQFYLDVDSVNCGENVCKVVTVRMFWDELGRYLKYELQNGGELEKKDGIPFTSDDYKKLKWVLKNKNSELKSVFKDDLVVSDFVEHGNVDVDAVSGATSTVKPSETVEGAVWTCFTLWHWANGEIISKIREINSKQLTNQDLINSYLQHKDIDYKKFAIESLLDKNAFDELTVSEIEKSMINSDYTVFKSGLKYIEALSGKEYFNAILNIIDKSNYKKRIACLNSVSKTNKGKNDTYYNQLSKKLDKFNFQEFEMFLTNVKQNHFSSPMLTEQLIKLLEAENFLIARRSYWFLSDQQTPFSSKQKKKIKSFSKKNRNRL